MVLQDYVKGGAGLFSYYENRPCELMKPRFKQLLAREVWQRIFFKRLSLL
jgi:hypothetical protein